MLQVEQFNNLIALIEHSANQTANKRSLTSFINTLKTNFPYKFRQIINLIIQYRDEIISSLSLEKTNLLAKLNVPVKERRIVFQIILQNKIDSLEQANSLFQANNLSYRFPAALTKSQLDLVVSKIRNFYETMIFVKLFKDPEIISEVSTYVKKFINLPVDKLENHRKILSNAYDQAMENILDKRAREICVETLKNYGHLTNIYAEKDLEELMRILYYEQKAVDTAINIRMSNIPMVNNPNVVKDLVALELVRFEP